MAQKARKKRRLYFAGRKAIGFRIRFVFYALLTAASFICAGAASSASAQVKQTVLWTFTGGSDGNGPAAALIADEKGALYSTAQIGGAVNSPLCFGVGCGTVFKLTPPAPGQTGWAETTLWSFSGSNDGANPFGALFARNESPSRKKTLYGTTFSAGILSGCGGFGCGTVFKLTDSSLTTLWGFTGGNDGGAPGGALIADEETGALYGTTSGVFTSGNGTVFKIDTTDQTLTTIYSFLGSPDGASPGKALLADDDGALYGTTFGGGLHGNGTVFKLTPPGRGQTAWTETVLWSFTGGNDGANPQAGLIADKRGALYGTTSTGSACGGCGTVFKLTPPAPGQTAWTLTTLWSFSGGSDGGSSFAGLIADRSGALYGTTENGGAINTAACPVTSGCGVVFKLIPREHGQVPWTQIVLWTFSGGSDGGIPQAELIADGSGVLYGTAVGGGNVNPQGPCGIHGCGVVFSLTGTGFATEDEQ